jgi:RNA polymerase sigma-70 factor (ECF subfamily)
MMLGAPPEIGTRDERSLVEWHRSGDPGAFDEIVRRFTPGLLAAARRRLIDQQAAEDAVQETFARAYLALPRFEGQYRLGGWLHHILANVCFDEGQRRRRQGLLVDRLEHGVILTEAVPADVEVDLDLDGALEQLPPEYREALVLRFVEDRSYTEVAAIAGISEQNARARASRARRIMRQILSGAAAFTAMLGAALRRGEQAASAHVVSAEALASAPEAARAVPMLTQIMQSGGAAIATVGVGVAASAVAFVTLTPDTTERALPAPPPAVSVVDHGRTTASTAVPVTVEGAVTDETTTSVDELATSTTLMTATTTADTTPPARPPAVAPVPIDDVGGEPAPAPEQKRGAYLDGEHLTVTPAGPRRDISGSLTISTADGDLAATVEGKLELSDSRVDGELLLRLADGRTLKLQLAGDVAPDGALSGKFILDGADRVGLDSDGTFTGSFVETDGTGALTLALNGGPAKGQPAPG